MAGFFSKAMDYLGLSDNDAYGEYEPYEDQAPSAPVRRQPERAAYDFDQPTVRAVPVVPVESGVGMVTPRRGLRRRTAAARFVRFREFPRPRCTPSHRARLPMPKKSASVSGPLSP